LESRKDWTDGLQHLCNEGWRKLSPRKGIAEPWSAGQSNNDLHILIRLFLSNDDSITASPENNLSRTPPGTSTEI
jgi:hypothetical protein